MLLELGLEVAVDNVAMWAEAEHGIEVTLYFDQTRSPLIWVFHGATAVAATAAGLFGVVRHPIMCVNMPVGGREYALGWSGIEPPNCVLERNFD